MMRLVERTLRNVKVAAKVTAVGTLGSVIEGFSATLVPYRCVIEPGGNTLNYAANNVNAMEHGVYPRRTLKLILPRNAVINIGDGVCVDDELTPCWRCIGIEQWSGHIAAKIERLA